MSTVNSANQPSGHSSARETEVIIIGAGVCGIYMLHKMLTQGREALVLEAGDDLGGTWYWNRYPGARFDSESYTYGYSFNREILEEWNWQEHFSAQPQTLEYLNFVADKLQVRPHMRFGARVTAARFNEQTNRWHVQLSNPDGSEGDEYICRFLCTAIGMLSAATYPRIPGAEDFKGESFHTYYWPKEPVSLAGRKVAVIGTGATGVQVISEIADKVGSLTVFQRRPNWCAPLHNSPISADEMQDIKARYDEIFAQCRATPNGFLHGPNRKPFDETTEAERLAYWNELYDSPGFGIWLSNYREVLMYPEANKIFSDFIADKIRARVNDPQVAEKLIPKDHGFGTRRVPLETRYYEAYNLPTTQLVDLTETPIERIDATGIQTSAEHYDFDLIIYATGFDAITGAFDRITFTGVGGQKLSDKWHDGPSTYLGAQVHGFPNLFTLAGPQSASVSTNFPPAIEAAVEWTADFIEWVSQHGYERVEASQAAEDEWVEHVKSFYAGSMLAETKSWFTGYNSNVDGHNILRHMVYFGGAHTYRQKLREIAEQGYEGFDFEGASVSRAAISRHAKSWRNGRTQW
ncbi:MAG: NAD(P)/FAD-dependent oxidoreductase, partial [Pseudomonadales bacterium]|nr:NAD(P)/FAD-dependent oxidoreductase [Pseudomonadales bacterium]